MTILEIAQQMRTLLKQPENWTTKVGARNYMGNPVYPNSDTAVCWCLDGALLRVTGNLVGDNIDKMMKVFNNKVGFKGYTVNMDYVLWNDAPERTHAEVLGLLEEIIHDHS